jgi:hypothetical protein
MGILTSLKGVLERMSVENLKASLGPASEASLVLIESYV